ncbi:MAG TPA: replication initiation factor domain-containing protein [Oculatellaceae cyanobacterium]
MDYTPTVVESRIDWITVTASTPEKRPYLFNFGLELVKLQASRDLPIRRWQWKGYDGQHAKGATVGRRGDSEILQLSGTVADEYFDLAWNHADHCTRVDLAVTVKVEEEVSGIIGQHEEEVCAWKREKPRSLSVSCIRNEGRPATLYLGQRVSDLYGRVYDKYLESRQPDYERCIRYEVEVKGSPAQRAASWLSSVGDRSNRIRDAVYKHCVQRGLSPRFSGVGGAVCLTTVRPTSDADSRLAWLASSVAPVVERLLAAGLEKELFAALGLRRSLEEMVRLRAQVEWGHHQNELWGSEDDE